MRVSAAQPAFISSVNSSSASQNDRFSDRACERAQVEQGELLLKRSSREHLHARAALGASCVFH